MLISADGLRNAGFHCVNAEPAVHCGDKRGAATSFTGAVGVERSISHFAPCGAAITMAASTHTGHSVAVRGAVAGIASGFPGLPTDCGSDQREPIQNINMTTNPKNSQP